MCRKDKNKEKETGIGPFFVRKLWKIVFAIFYYEVKWEKDLLPRSENDSGNSKSNSRRETF